MSFLLWFKFLPSEKTAVVLGSHFIIDVLVFTQVEWEWNLILSGPSLLIVFQLVLEIKLSTEAFGFLFSWRGFILLLFNNCGRGFEYYVLARIGGLSFFPLC